MTAVFLLAVAGVLVGFAVAWRARASVPAGDVPDAERSAASVQLEALGTETLMHPVERTDEAQRLQRELLQDGIEPAPAAAPSGQVGAPGAVLVGILVALVGIGLYGWQQLPFWQRYQEFSQAPEVPPDVQAMVQRLETRLAQGGGSAQEWQRLARSYGVLGRIVEAQRAYARAATLDPDDVLLLDGYAALDAPPPPPAPVAAILRRAEAAVRATPQDARAWARLAFARARLGEQPGARDAYARAYALDPRPELLAAYAAAEYGLDPERPSERAVELYREVLAQDPDAPTALWVLGLAALQAGRAQRAGELFDRLLAQLPEDAPLRPLVEEARRRAQPPS